MLTSKKKCFRSWCDCASASASTSARADTSADLSTFVVYGGIIHMDGSFGFIFMMFRRRSCHHRCLFSVPDESTHLDGTFRLFQ